MGYFFYYPDDFDCGSVVFLFIVLNFFEKLSFVLVTSFFIYYLIYIFVPVAGPQFYFPLSAMIMWRRVCFLPSEITSIIIRSYCPGPGYDHGFFYNLVEGSQQIGERPTAAFPSSHVGISTILMIMAWRGSRRLLPVCFLSMYCFVVPRCTFRRTI